MNVAEVLQLVDQLVFKHTGNHLNDLQKNAILGIWEGKTYTEIASDFGYESENYIGKISRQLYDILSKELGEDINKNNFCWTIERVLNNHNHLVSLGNNNNINYCPNHKQEFSDKSKDNINNKSTYHDLTLAPQIIKFYNRDTELNTLSNWILNQNIRLISVLGLSGIGKSYLMKRFIDLNLKKIELIIWKSLKYPQSLDSLINDFIKICQQESKENIQAKLKQLFDIFVDKKCLIILDDVQNLFIRGEFAGQYQSEYQDYQNFFKMITETNHQSNIILISQEKCTEMECLDEELYPIKCLELDGLFNPDLLKNWGLKDEDRWLDLVNLYEGNLFYLKSVALLINNNYDGQVGEFLAENTLLITNQMQCHFREKFEHLSPPEQEIVLQLSKVEQPMAREDLRQSLNLSSVDFNNGLQSLQKRYLVKKIKADKISFKLSPIFQEYVRNFDTNSC